MNIMNEILISMASARRKGQRSLVFWNPKGVKAEPPTAHTFQWDKSLWRTVVLQFPWTRPGIWHMSYVI